MRHTRYAVLVIALVTAVATMAAAASAGGNGDFNYIANPPMLKGRAVSSFVGAHFPGVGNHCEVLFDAPPPLACYDPTQIRNAYNVPADLTGKGQTIVIVVAYGDPNIEEDLAAFDAFFGLPDPPSFTVYHGSNTQKAGPNDAASWTLETALDVEWAHAIAPGAALVLAEAPSPSGNAINTTERQIVPKYPGAIVSQSFGIYENALTGNGNNIHVRQATKNYADFSAMGDTVLAGASDFGATSGTSSNTADYPASDPNVTGVGGTQGLPYPYGLCESLVTDDCTYGGEQVWNEPDVADVPLAAGGAPSQLFPTPAYQTGATGLNTRATPDVAYNAALNGGVLVVQLPSVYLVGGTSAGTPQWAGIFALANEARAGVGKGPIGPANPRLYAIYGNASKYAADFHDVTTGNNTLAGAPVQGFSAKAGYDLASGLGTPDAASLIADLVAQP